MIRYKQKLIVDFDMTYDYQIFSFKLFQNLPIEKQYEWIKTHVLNCYIFSNKFEIVNIKPSGKIVTLPIEIHINEFINSNI